jgi:hypothetical protein
LVSARQNHWAEVVAASDGDIVTAGPSAENPVAQVASPEAEPPQGESTVAEIRESDSLIGDGATPVDAQPVQEKDGPATPEALSAASEAAFSAADDISKIFIKNKHLSSFHGNYAKYATTDKAEVQSLVAEALRSDAAIFKTNGLAGTFKVQTDLGRAIGTRGQTGIRAIVADDGRVINNFPIHVEK